MKIKGTGSIRPVKSKDGSIVKNSWQLIVSQGYDPITGKRVQRTRHFRGTKTQARRACEEFRRELEHGLKIDADKVVFKEYADGWCEAREAAGQLAPSTIKRDKNALKHINGYIGKVPLSDIDASVVRAIYAQLGASGLGQSSLVRVHIVLNQILKQAVEDDLILRNPCDAVKPPKQKKSNIGKALDQQEITRLVRALDDLEAKEYPNENKAKQKSTLDMAHTMVVRIILSTGMRHGEVLGLSWSDIDFKQAALTVRHTLDKDTKELKEPKTENSKRVISLDAYIIQALRKWSQVQKHYLNYLGIEQGKETAVITGETGMRLDSNNLLRWWRSFRNKKGFDGLRLHDLRHTHATFLVSGGLNIKAVSTRLGHAGVGITLDLYAHARREDDLKAASMIGEVVSSSVSETVDDLPCF